MRRILLVGCPGSGKTTVARALADGLGVHHIELDQLYHGPDWTPTPVDRFRTELTAALDRADAETDGWVVCGNYNTMCGNLREARADAVVWLNQPKATVMRRVTLRTVKRGVTRRELWNGNREPFTNFYRWDPEANIIRWAWINYDKYQRQYEGKLSDGSWSGLQIHRLRNDDEVARFLADATGGSRGS